MLSSPVLISDAVFLELVEALNQYEEEEEEGGHDVIEGKQESGKDELPVTRKRKQLSMDSKSLYLLPSSLSLWSTMMLPQFCISCPLCLFCEHQVASMAK